jgi:hypothetical protein
MSHLTVSLLGAAENGPDPGYARNVTLEQILASGRPGNRPSRHANRTTQVAIAKYIRTRMAHFGHVSFWHQNRNLRNEPNLARRVVTLVPKSRFAKRTQPRPWQCHTRAKIAICETNPTSPVAVSHSRQNRDLRNEPNLARCNVTIGIDGTSRRNSAIVTGG